MDILKLTKSKTRAAIFQLYFSAPRKSYYLRELERMINFSAANIRRELLPLVKNNIFVTEKKGNLFYYQLNTVHPLYHEIKSLVFKTIGIEGELKKIVHNAKGVVGAFIFGSFASGEENSNSDIDLYLIIDRKKFSEDDFIGSISRFERKINREINYHYMEEKEFLLKKQTNSFIGSILKGKKIILFDNECFN